MASTLLPERGRASRLVALAVCGIAATGARAETPHFVERAVERGLTFVHRHYGTGEKYMHETFGSGLVLFDADGDDRLDVYFLQGAPTSPGQDPSPNQLYVQGADGRFSDATRRAGVGDTGYGMGAAYGDVDRDGDLDLYVTNFGPNVLYRNRGDGTFEDVTQEAGLASPLWNTSTGFFDADGDGDLDLYVVGYVDFGLDNHKFCGDVVRGLRAYCHPDVYEALPDALFLNDGRGRFREADASAGVPRTRDGKGLGLAFADLDRDGTVDVYVSNDSTMNYLLLGRGKGRFEETALLAGAGYNGAGAAEASMGVDVGDLDGDGLPEIFVTHLDEETNTLYRNSPGALFDDVTTQVGLAAPSLPWVGFGTLMFDHDHDGDLDIFVANGHIIDNIAQLRPGRAYRQPAQLFDNRDGRFVEVSERLGLEAPIVGRGAVAGDLDHDGDLDIVVSQNGDRALLLENRGSHGNALQVRLVGTESNVHGFGAWVELRVGQRTQVREVKSAASYLAQSPPDVHFGIAAATRADELVIHWPSGHIDRHGPLAAGARYTITEGSPEVVSKPFRKPTD